MSLNKENQLFYKGENLDYNTYIVEATDSIDTSVFYGQVYVNDVARSDTAFVTSNTLFCTLGLK